MSFFHSGSRHVKNFITGLKPVYLFFTINCPNCLFVLTNLVFAYKLMNKHVFFAFSMLTQPQKEQPENKHSNTAMLPAGLLQQKMPFIVGVRPCCSRTNCDRTRPILTLYFYLLLATPSAMTMLSRLVKWLALLLLLLALASITWKARRIINGDLRK